MSHRLLALIACLLAIGPWGCSIEVQNVERFPGFESAPPESLCTLRESGSVLLQAVDGRDSKGFVLSVRKVNRQFQVPAGDRSLTLAHSENSGGIYFPGAPTAQSATSAAMRASFRAAGVAAATLTFTLEPGHEYSFVPNYRGRNWRPNLYDLTAGKAVRPHRSKPKPDGDTESK